MFKRLWLLIRAWMGEGLDKLEDPELLLEQAQQEMTEMHRENRARAVAAIMPKNNLAKLVADTERAIAEIEKDARAADRAGYHATAEEERRKAAELRVLLVEAEERLVDAIRAADRVKQEIKDEEVRIRDKTADALALKAQLRNLQIEHRMRSQLRNIDHLEDRTGPPMPAWELALWVAIAVVGFISVIAFEVRGAR